LDTKFRHRLATLARRSGRKEKEEEDEEEEEETVM
jgi:hypothetical protein